MKVAIIHDYLDAYGGAEVLANAIFEIFPKADLYTATYDEKLINSTKIFKDAKVFCPKWLKYFPKKLLILFLPFYFENLDLSKYDLVISSTAHFAKGVKTNKNQVHISYIHTPPRFLYGYDSSIKNRNSWFLKIFLWPIDFYLKYKDQQFAKRPDYLLCNSNEVKKRIKKFYQRDAKVIYPFPQVKVDQNFFEYVKKEGKSDYFLIISRLTAYKNIDLVINALGKKGLPLQIGGTGPQKKYLEELSKNYKTVNLYGFVNDDEKELLYQNCKAFLATVQNEDFGMSVLEPMMYGKPVIALRSGGYLETIVENKTGIFFDFLNEESLLEAIKKIDTIKWNPDEIRKHALTFSKEKFQKEIKEFVKEKVKFFS